MTEGNYSDVPEKLSEVRERIRASAQRAGRQPGDVEMVAVTKGHPIGAVRALLNAGHQVVGENRVGEALAKQRELGSVEGLTWEMVGHIQSRKARDLVGNFARVHSVDRMKIARRLARLAQERSLVLPALIECNVSGEESKYGFAMANEDSWSEALGDVREICQLAGLEVEGLMTMAPWTDDEAVLRSTFARLRRLGEYLRRHVEGFKGRQLSMGMTDDFELAIEEGATIVRIGRALLGERSV